MNDPQIIAIYSQDCLDFGGVETHIFSIIEHGRKVDTPVIFIGKVSDAFESKIRSVGADIIPFYIWDSSVFSSFFKLANILKKNRVSLVHIHGHKGSFLGRFASWYCKIPVMITVHLSLLDIFGDANTFLGKLKFFIAIITDAIFNHLITRKVIFVSKKSMERLISLRLAPRSKCIYIPNGVDLNKFSKKSTLPKKAQITMISFVGRLHHQKGVDVLLKSLSQIPDLNIKVQIIGDGPEKSSLTALAERLGITDRVSFLGERSDVPELLSSSDIFVLPSRFEAMPYALIEALAAGLPSIVSDVGEHAYLIDQDQCGILVPVEDPSALAGAIEQLVGQADLRRRMGEKARAHASEFSETVVLENLFGVYDKIHNSDKKAVSYLFLL